MFVYFWCEATISNWWAWKASKMNRTSSTTKRTQSNWKTTWQLRWTVSPGLAEVREGDTCREGAHTRSPGPGVDIYCFCVDIFPHNKGNMIYIVFYLLLWKLIFLWTVLRLCQRMTSQKCDITFYYIMATWCRFKMVNDCLLPCSSMNYSGCWLTPRT